MSMITEQIEKLRDYADIAEICDDVSMKMCAKAMREAADTIEQLAAKLQALNKKTMFSYFDGIADSMKEDNKELEAYQKAFEDIRAEIKDLHKSHMINFVSADGAVDTCLEIIDKHDPSKAGKENDNENRVD